MRTTKEVRELRAELEKLTGRKPVSFEERYLRRRLADLTKKSEAGEDVRHRADSCVIAFSTTEDAREALDGIIEDEKLKPDGAGSMSKLMRAALAFWARKHGYASQADVIGGD